MERLVAGIAMCIAFVVMASVFSPSSSRGDASHDSGHAAIGASHETHSVDPHEGLRSLGSIDHGRYHVQIWATRAGTRYTVFDADGRELGALLGLDQVDRHFPDLELGSLDHGTTLMLADPADR